MSEHTFLRSLFGLFVAGIFAYVIFERSDSELENAADHSLTRQRYMPYVSNTLLPVFVLAIFILGIIESDLSRTMELMFSTFFGIFLHICVYYLILLLLLPLLRRFVSARACATLWLIPNYLYFVQDRSIRPSAPWWVIHIPTNVLTIIFLIWITGCIGILLWSVVTHLCFRFLILKNAQPVTDPAVQVIWMQEQQRAGYDKAPYQLVSSPGVRTPLSIGFFQKTIRVVLPENDYSPDDLSLIFRHELVHIGRNDCGTKFFLTFCTAICWFNPLMWIAMRRSADDLELSCDETVLLDADGDQRRQYAHLILRTAGDERGFTTCLSASAKALRYRLRNIVKPRKRLGGALIIALVFFVLIMSCGYVAVAYSPGTGTDFIFDGQDPGQCTITSINLIKNNRYHSAEVSDPQSFIQYIASLKLTKLTGIYNYSDDIQKMTVIFQSPKGAFGIHLTDHSLKITPLYDDLPQQTYYIDDTIDWNYLNQLIVFE